MDKDKIKAIFDQHPGARARLAEKLGVYRSAITLWFQGHPSKRIQKAAAALAVQLLKEKKKKKTGRQSG